MKWKKMLKGTAAMIAGMCSAVMLSVGYYNGRLPDKVMTDGGDKLPQFNTVLPITASSGSGIGSGYIAANAGTSRTDRTFSLRLFGSVPIKDIKEETVDRPQLLAGGEAFGIKLVTDGVMIIDMKKLSGKCPAGEAGLKIGDVIESVNGEKVYTNSRVSEIIRDSEGKGCKIKYRRGDKELECTVKPVLNEGCYRAGMWVRDSSAGIGTMTFIDPQTGIFAGLGHSVCDADTHEPLPLSHGTISPVIINGMKKGAQGEPGQLIGEFSGSDCGELLLNCGGGIYGSLDSIPETAEEYPMAFGYEVHKGDAYILTQTDSGEPKKFSITIEDISVTGGEHDLVISTDDEELLEESGGIVQGMSGSPIIQDGMLAGAVTHVFIDDPTGGYGILAERMYEYSQQAADIARSGGEDSKMAG